MAAERTVGSMNGVASTPLSEDVESGNLQSLYQQLNMKTKSHFDDLHKLKPIDVKDIEKPDILRSQRCHVY